MGSFLIGQRSSLKAAALFFSCFSLFFADAQAQSASPPPASAARKPLAPQDLRPPADMLTDCAQAPKGAIVSLPADLAAWATVYCTKEGAIFSPNENRYGVFPDSKLRAVFAAAELDDLKGADRAGAYYKTISYQKWSESNIEALLKVDPASERIVRGKTLYRLDLTTNKENSLSFLVINPQTDPFWVFPLTNNGLGAPAFFVVSLQALNRTH